MRFNPNATILAGTPASTLQLWLTTAQAAYNSLLTGAQTVSVGYDGKNVTFKPADVGALEAYITVLQRMLGQGAPRRAIRPYFR